MPMKSVSVSLLSPYPRYDSCNILNFIQTKDDDLDRERVWVSKWRLLQAHRTDNNAAHYRALWPHRGHGGSELLVLMAVMPPNLGSCCWCVRGRQFFFLPSRHIKQTRTQNFRPPDCTSHYVTNKNWTSTRLVYGHVIKIPLWVVLSYDSSPWISTAQQWKYSVTFSHQATGHFTN